MNKIPAPPGGAAKLLFMQTSEIFSLLPCWASSSCFHGDSTIYPSIHPSGTGTSSPHPFCTKECRATVDKATCGPHYHHHLWSLNTNMLKLANLNYASLG